jgi:hypothetical protein
LFSLSTGERFDSGGLTLKCWLLLTLLGFHAMITVEKIFHCPLGDDAEDFAKILDVPKYALYWMDMFSFKFVTVTFSMFLHQGILEVIFDNSLNISFSSSSFVFSPLSSSKEIVIVALLGNWLHFCHCHLGFNSFTDQNSMLLNFMNYG